MLDPYKRYFNGKRHIEHCTELLGKFLSVKINRNFQTIDFFILITSMRSSLILWSLMNYFQWHEFPFLITLPVNLFLSSFLSLSLSNGLSVFFSICTFLSLLLSLYLPFALLRLSLSFLSGIAVIALLPLYSANSESNAMCRCAVKILHTFQMDTQSENR